jgi:SPP1 gp7 family putative phage head morphogenesis protein
MSKKTRFLKPPSASRELERELSSVLMSIVLQIVFGNILTNTSPDVTNIIANSVDDIIIEAIKSRQIIYENGVFKGKFSPSISKALLSLGARMNPATKGFEIDLAKVPQGIQSIARDILSTEKVMANNIYRKLTNINVASMLSDAIIAPVIKKIVNSLEQRFANNIDNNIGVNAVISEQTQQKISEIYETQIKQSITNLSQEKIESLRAIVQEQALGGMRFKDLTKIIETQFNITKKRAKLIAQQETRFITSSYTQARYAKVGITKYKWSTSSDSRVRKGHAELNGKIFQFDSPPITNPKTGKRANPGQDFGCRCVAIPIFDF